MREMNRVVRHEDRWALYVDDVRRWVTDVETTIEAMSDWSIGASACYGGYVAIAGRTLKGFVAIVYKFLDDRREIDSKIRLVNMESKLYEDTGHAIEACIDWIKREG